MWLEGRKLTNLIVVEVIETLKGEVLLLDLLDHFLWQLLELSQRGHGLPPVESRDTEHQRPASADKTKLELLWRGKSGRLTFSCRSSCRDSWSCRSVEPSPC